MQYRDYGKTGFKVSALGMGCMRLPCADGEDGSYGVDLEKAFEIIRYAADHGVNYFDTAYSYHGTHSESILGEALDGGRREKVMIATKQPFSVMKTQADVRRNLENTLKKLRTDYLDIYLIHNIQTGLWDEIKRRKIIEEYEKFRSEGLIRAIGFSYHGGYDGFADILGHYDWDMCQVQYNMMDTDREVTTKAIEIAGQKGTAIAIMEPLRGGGLSNAPTVVQELYDKAETKRTPTQWAFRHLLDFPQISTILSGMSSLEQLKQNLATFSAEDAVPGCLTDAEKAMLVGAKAAYESIVTIPCTGCGYCMPCPHGVAIPSAFSLYNEGMMFGNFDQPRRSYMFSTEGGRSADLCVQCGACERKCPQAIPIIEQLKVAHEALKGWRE
jgi:predicted aldo/keto reductase-like oxidoreductase